ncbi:MAG: hypothetical protein EG825_00435 [Rhodocyclaceae bacterium]|nr:hypothetical protein [Rhodocyclaceae bacterium]
MNETLSKIGLIAIVLLVGFLAGVKVQDWRFNAKEKAVLEKKIKAEREEVSRLNKLAMDIGLAMAKDTRARMDEQKKHKAEIEDWKKKGAVYVECGSGIKTVNEAAIGFGADYISLWNGGLCLAMSGDERQACYSIGANDSSGGANTFITPSKLITNIEDNAYRWGECRNKILHWQRIAKESGLTP